MIRQRNFRAFEARYHRNGIGGEGFFLCRFKYRALGAKDIDMQAIVFDAAGRVAVTSFDINDRWRGDEFEDALRAAIEACTTAQPEKVY